MQTSEDTVVARHAAPNDAPTALPPNYLRPRRVVAIFALALFMVWLVYVLGTTPAFGWPVVLDYLFSKEILHGLWVTVELVALAMTIGVVLGVILAVMRLSRSPLIAVCASAYIWFFRGTPVLVQLIFWYNFAALSPKIGLGIPFGGPKILEADANAVFTSLVAATIGLGLNEAAYYAEIVRGGILSVDSGQTMAAKALGLTPSETMRRIVLPQAMKAIIPPTGNQIISMLKYSSLASVVALQELLHSAQAIYLRSFQIIPLLVVASIWYLVLVSILSVIQRRVERHFGRGSAPITDDAISAIIARSVQKVRGTARARRGRAHETSIGAPHD